MMKKKFLFLLVGLLVFSCILLPTSLSAAISLSQWSNAGLELTSEAITDSAAISSIVSELGDKDGLDASQKKLSSNLLALTDDTYLLQGESRSDLLSEMKDQGQISQMPVSNGISTASKTGVYVYIRLQGDYDIDTLKPYCLSIENYDEDAALMAAWVDMDQIATIAALDQVQSMMEVMPPMVNEGSVVSEGDEILRAAQVRNTFDADGSGVKIGVISDGVDHISTAIDSGDLPASVTVLSNEVGGDEGTAMMEIIYDLAPGAQLYFHDCGDNRLAFNEAIDDLVAAGCDIICDDISWFIEPYFEDGVIAQHMKEISDHGDVLFVSSAGNTATRHYQGSFEEYGSGFHDFSNGTSTDYKSLYVNLPPGAAVAVVLQWNEPTYGVENDYDLILANHDTADILALSNTDNTWVDLPLEALYYENNTDSDITAEILVQDRTGSGSNILETYIYGYSGASVYSNNLVAVDSIYGHAAVPGVLACGAIDAAELDTIENYSSQGPITMITETREKPDLCGVDGVSVTGSGGFPSTFYGTSAAAPHVAAVAALVESRFNTLSTDDVRNILLDSANDLGDSGFDSVYGYGLVDALNAATAYCNVSFDSCGGSAVSTEAVVTGSQVTAPSDPDRDGYKFAGWYSDEGLNHLYDFNTAVTSDITLYAGWTIDFDDVDEDAWYLDGVNFAVMHHLFLGVGNNCFAPNEKMTRAMFVSVLYRFAGEPQVDETGIDFDDVADGAWYTNGVIWAAAEEITYGTGQNMFDPHASITREEMVTMLNRYLEKESIQLPYIYDETAFADEASIASWAKDSVGAMQRAGIICGKTSNTFCPKAVATRAEAAVIMYRLMMAMDA